MARNTWIQHTTSPRPQTPITPPTPTQDMDVYERGEFGLFLRRYGMVDPQAGNFASSVRAVSIGSWSCAVNCAVASPDGEWIAVVGDDLRVWLLSRKTGYRYGSAVVLSMRNPPVARRHQHGGWGGSGCVLRRDGVSYIHSHLYHVSSCNQTPEIHTHTCTHIQHPPQKRVSICCMEPRQHACGSHRRQQRQVCVHLGRVSPSADTSHRCGSLPHGCCVCTMGQYTAGLCGTSGKGSHYTAAP